MNRHAVLSMVLLASTSFQVGASDTRSSSDAYKVAQSKAASQYAEDKKLCAEESNSSARMQCLRDAKSEYNKALTAAKTSAPADRTGKPTSPVCADCAQVINVTVGEKKGEGGALGIIGGGVAGALLGSQVGSGRGKTAATILGAAGGAYAGHKVEEKVKSTKIWSVKVHFEGGEERTIDFDHDPGLKGGDLVKVSGNTISPR